jgi:dTDP-4-amino-4,6-dideoxygalactose transaminase
MSVDIGGVPCDYAALRAIAARHGLVIVDDAAHALPSRYRGRLIGSVADLTAFSFYATKTLTTGEGGMLLTDDERYAERARTMSLHGMSRDAWNRYGAKGSWFYEVVRPGFKYNLTDIAAALGLRQLQKLEGFQARRTEIARRYTEAFSRLEELQVPVSRAGVGHAWHLYVLRLNLESLRVTREQFIEEMRERRIGTSVHFIPVHTHPYYRDRYGFAPEDFPVAAAEFRRIVSLPLNPRMSDRDVEDVVEAVADVVEKFRR